MHTRRTATRRNIAKPAQKFNIVNYKCSRSDRLTGKNRGTAILIKHNIKHRFIENFKTRNLESTVINIIMSKSIET